jgi:hypothetical protein
MPSNTDLQMLMKKAKEHEEKYEWFEAAKSYEQALQLEPGTVTLADLSERIGFCYSLASRQAESEEESRRLRQSAVEAYKNAAQLLEKEDSLKSQGRSAHCKAVAEYLSSWIEVNPSGKRERLDECLRLGKKSLEAYEKEGDELDYGKMCNGILTCVLERFYVASDWRELRNIVQEGMDYVNKTIQVLSKLDNKDELLRAYYTASLQGWYAANFCELEEKAQKELVQKSLTYSEKALMLSREVNDPYHAAMANWAAAFCTLTFTEKAESSLEYAKEMLKQGMIVKDNYLKGIASYVLAFVTDWMMLREADPDKKKDGYRNIIKYSDDAVHCLQVVSQDFFIAETCLFYAESYSSLGCDVEAPTEERRLMLRKAVEIGRKGLEHATRSGSQEATCSTLHALSKALHFYSNLETEKDEKARLLEEAFVHRKGFDQIVEKAFPSNDWVSGVNKSYEGQIKVAMARIETDSDKKRVLLESSVSEMEDAVSHCKRWILSRPVHAHIAALAAYEDSFGGILGELYLIAHEKKILQKAVEVHEDAAKQYKKVNLPSRAAESYWKMARNQDLVGQHIEAAENFERAFTEYTAASQALPNFADFCLDYATYMKAWSEIERAVSAHEREKYADAMQHYEKIANFLKQTKSWSYLSSNFLAWSLLEKAEDLSRKESSTESVEAFSKAADLFKEAKEAFEKETAKVQNIDEKDKAVELVKASMRRKDYCLARANVEEARIADREGEHMESAKRYDSAADIFERMLTATENEVERKEIEPFAYMCRAWEKMKMADGKVSSELYHEASDQFLEVKAHSTKDKVDLFASGASAFCKALEHGTRFESTREKEDFLKAKQYLESAANYYLKAGFDNASVWTSATEILFDAYNYLISAEIEEDHEKKTKAYLLVEKCLERSAGLYEKAGYVGKRDEVCRTLEKVKEKREFAVSLGELMMAPSEASSTKVISAPRMTIEEPVGFSKFERAFVQANLIAGQREVVVGGSLDIEIQFVNLGKNAAFLTRVEAMVPQGFDIVGKPEKCVVEDGSLSFKGKRVAALETGEIKLSLKPKKKGNFILKPRLQYMDESGEYRFSELEQVPVSVKEIGILGWLKGQG